jgi:hypothetical protein
MIDEDAISSLECIENGAYVKLYKAPDNMVGFIDRDSNNAIVGF